MSDDSFKTRKTLKVGKQQFDYFSLPAAEQAGVGAVGRLPMSLKILLENLLRFEDGNTRSQRGHQGARQLGGDAAAGRRDRVSARARADAGFHRRAGCCGSRGDAQRRRGGRARSEHHQSAVAGRSGHRPLGDGRQVRHEQGVR